MSKTAPQRSLPPGEGFFEGVSLRIKLIARLVADARISPLIKALPFSVLIYMIFPDLLPGPIDDAMLLWTGTVLFVELCPPEIVDEHWDRLRAIAWTQSKNDSGDDEDIIEGVFRELD